MQRIALHTRLKPGREREYDSVHRTIPAELDRALRAAGPDRPEQDGDGDDDVREGETA